MGSIEKVSQFEDMTRIALTISNGAAGFYLVYCIEENQFYIYKDGVWQTLFELEIEKMILEHPEYTYVVKYTDDKRKQIVRVLKVYVQKRLEFFNAKGYLNFDIGEFDPVTLNFYDHNKDNYSTMRINYPYDHSATCPLWLSTIEEILEKDNNKINMIQEFFGYCLTRDTSHRKSLLLLGESNCGKSTILNVLRSMVGSKNCSSVVLKWLSNPQYTPMLMNKLVNIDSDVSSAAEDFEANFKVIASGEPINCNQKFIKTFDFTPYCKLVMAANVFPKIKDHSSAVYNKLLVIPCNRIFTEKEMNRNLSKELDKELSGIFNWAVQGLRRLQQRGMFEELDFIKEAVQELEDENNPTNVFFEEHVEVEMLNNTFVEKMDLFNKYIAWCTAGNHFKLSRARFGSAVYKKFHKETPKDTKDLRTGKRIWRNIRYVDQKGEAQGEVIQWQE